MRETASSRVVGPFLKVASGLGLSPNALTIIGLVISLAAAGVVAAGNLLAGGLVALFAGFFDMLDGAMARSQGKATKFGAFMDSVVDRVSEAALLFGLVVLYTPQGSNWVVYLAFICLTGSFLTSYLRARAEGLGMSCKVGVLTRAERVILLGLGLVLDQVFVALIIVAALSWATVAQRVAHIWNQTKTSRQ